MWGGSGWRKRCGSELGGAHLEAERPTGHGRLVCADLVRCDGRDEVKESARWMMEDDGRCEEATNSGRGSQVRWVNEVGSGMAMEEMWSNWSRDFDRWNLRMIVERISARWETGGREEAWKWDRQGKETWPARWRGRNGWREFVNPGTPTGF